MVLDIILPILVELITDPIKNYVVTPIKRHVSYAFKCDSNVQRLQHQVKQLQNKKERMQKSVADAERNGEDIFLNVTTWLTAAETNIGEADMIIQGKDEAMNKCFFGFCPNLKTRYQLSKRSDKKALAIDELCNEQGLDPISSQPPMQQIVEPSLYSREALPSRVLMLNQVMDALKDPSLQTIGVYGMGGVGKTTLANEVQAKALQEKLFETVVMVAVSQSPELRRMQGEIADFLGMKFSAEEIPGRASQLRRRLENSKALLILDDLWHKLDLNVVGIPSQGCKIMLTSRSRELLSNEMQTQKLFSLEALQEEETLSLFRMSVAAEAKDPKFHSLATEIAKRCGGLPLLIQIVARYLKNKELYEWRRKLNQLSGFSDEQLYQKVYRVLQSSYENLPEEEIKQFFLLCGLFGQSNIQIRYLLTHSMGLGLFQRIHTVEAAWDNVFTMIDILKAESLLLDGDMAGYVKMHDVVRDTALSIASRVQHAFIGAGEGEFRDWPNRNCTRMSLPYCNVCELPEALECPEAQVFLFFTEDLSLEIPDRFFGGMTKLKVVDLRGMRLVSFPSSFSLLANLQTLCLHKCRLDSLAVIGELRQLEYLSFANSKVVELPRETEALSRLKLLDLQGCSDLRVIHENLFSKLCSLEELYMLDSFVRWNARGNVCFVELESLARLSTLEIQIPDPKMIPEGFKCFSQLRRYKISIGCSWDWKGHPERSRMLKLKVEAGVCLEYDPELLLRETEDLGLDGVRGAERIFYLGFPKLKHMHIESDYDIQHLIKSTTPASYSAFPVLESLSMRGLQRLETICIDQLGMGSFGQLRVLKISDCNKLSSLFSFSSMKCLQKLQVLEVLSCINMEAVIGDGSEVNDEGIEFTQLSSMKLAYLPNLTGFCKIKEGTGQMGMLFNSEMVSFPNLTSLEVVECKHLKHIFSVSMVNCLMQLKNLKIFACESVEEIIQSKKLEEIEEDDNTEAIVFPKLDYLSLEILENVKWFNSCYSIKFLSLRELSIRSCPNMRNFVGRDSSSESTEEYLFNEMVTFSNLETIDINYMGSIKYLWDEQHIADDSFSKLKSISIGSCSKLEVVFPSEICTRFRRVETLSLFNCGVVAEIYPRINLKEVNNPFSLRELGIRCLESLKHIWNKESEWNKGLFSIFQNLQSVVIRDCEDLKYVFPASVGCGLSQLQHLKLENCDQLEVMIAKAKDDEGSIDASFQFPQLKELHFTYLEKMKSLYEGGSRTLECPNLKSLEVVQCSNISLGKFTSNLEELITDRQGFRKIHGYAELCSKLKKITLWDVYEDTSVAVLHKSLEMLVLRSCSLKEMSGLLDQRLTRDEQQHCLRVKHLELLSISKLKYVAKKDSQFNQHLQTLLLATCHDLMAIAPSSTCLQNLTTLHVYRCLNMKNLVTASTAKTLVHLIEMEVQNCGNMEEIVAKDGDAAEHDVKIFFSKLQRLELASLHNLSSFCSGKYAFSFPLLEQVTIRDCSKMKIFCGGAVRTPKLRGVLFEDEQQWEGNLNATISAQLRTWVGDHLGDGRCFKNLELLELVNSTISSKAVLLANQMHFLNKLSEITVRDCDSIQVVFDLEGLSAEEGYIGLLPNLQELKLANLPLVTQLCSKAPKGILDFSILTTLSIDNCSRLEYTLTWSMASCLPQLKWVTVKNCEMMETFIVDDEDVADKVTFKNLIYVVLENMPKFSCFYSGSGVFECPSLTLVTMSECPSIKALLISMQVHPGNQVLKGMDFSRLEELIIDNCSRLEYAFTCSMAACLSQLQRLCLKNCEMMETFIGDEEDVAAQVTLEKLRLVILENMPKFSSFYLGNSDLEFPSLEWVSINECPSIKSLLIGMQVHSNTQVFPKLEKLMIDMKSVRGMIQFEGPSHLSLNVEYLELWHCSATTTSHVLLARFLSRFLNLDQLEICDSSFREFLDSYIEEAPTLSCIKSLTLTDLHKLCKMWWHASLFQSLETLTVYRCNQLMNLMTPSMAKSMMRLKILTVSNCDKLMEIVGDGSDHTTDEIVFPKLESLELSCLESLKAFSLTHYNFNFPCLDNVYLYSCPNLRIFCNGLLNTEILNCVSEGRSSENSYWLGNLNATIQHLYHQMVGFRYGREIKLSAFPVLKERWEAQFPTGFFLSSLKRLEVDRCELFTNAIPSHVLEHLESLEVVIVEKCDSVEQVIDLEGLNADEMRNLEQLHLIDLPRLKQVLWSKDPQQILSFKNLQTLKVDNCGSLTFIFNLSMALSLQNLQHVEVKNCCLVEHIIVISEEETVQQYQENFPSLQSLTILHLANLVGFCSTSGVLECPSLNTIEVADCPNVELFASTFSEGRHSSITVEEKGKSVGIEDFDSISAFLGTKIVMPGLEELKVEWNALKDQLFGNCPSRFVSQLKCIELTSFQGEENANFPPNFLQHFLSLEKLCLTDSLIEEILFDNLGVLEDSNHESLGLLTKLKLSNLPKLKHLVRDDCRPAPLINNLVDLEVVECSELKILVPSSVSFQNLTLLAVSKCDGLINLLSASTARSLVKLKRMDVEDCKMMKEIVAVASDGEEHEIRFSQLEFLKFDGLPCLESFSSGNCDFRFPSLKEVTVTGCPNMKNFAEKVSVSPKLRKVKTGPNAYDWEWEGSLNNTIQFVMQKDAEETAAINN